ncbi:MAG TPA: hypothetical protein VGJ34_00580 [Gaiellaceae bacterium]|jgi:hypothetical protein
MTELSNPPTIEPTHEWLLEQRDQLVRAIEAAPLGAPSRRPSRRLVLVAAALVLVVTGSALAATGVNILDWLRSSNPGEARFSIDDSRTVKWPAPERFRATIRATGVSRAPRVAPARGNTSS